MSAALGLVDFALERMVVMQLVAKPELMPFADPRLDSHVLGDMQARALFEAVCELRSRGEQIDDVTIDTELERRGFVDRSWFRSLPRTSAEQPEVFAVRTASLVRLAEHRAVAIAAADEVARSQAELDHNALGDCDPDEFDEDGQRKRNPDPPAPTLSWEWATPLLDYLGDAGEPDDDDAEDWIIRDLIPRGEPFLFGGAWKGGKTWTAIAIALSVALGRPFLGFENTLGRPGRVFLIALEDGKRRMLKRVWQVARGLGIRADDPRVTENLRIGEKAIRIPGDAKTLARFVAEQKRWQPDVILIDSLTRAMTGSQNDIRDATAFTAAWRELGIEIGCASGFLHHTNKPPEQGARSRAPADPINKMRGSGELLAAPRNLIVMERLGAADSKISAVTMRGNLDLHRSSFALEWERTTDADNRVAVTLTDRGDVEDLRRQLADAKKAERQTEKQKKTDRIAKTALRIARDREWCSAATLGVVLGVEKRTAARYLQDLREQGLLGPATEQGSSITDAGRSYLGGVQ